MDLQIVESVANAVGLEYMRASMKHRQFRSAYEGAAILREKYELLWETVKGCNVEQMRAAAIRLAATALRFVVDTCPPPEAREKCVGKEARGQRDTRREREVAAFERWQRASTSREVSYTTRSPKAGESLEGQGRQRARRRQQRGARPACRAQSENPCTRGRCCCCCVGC
jgi:hypothetical protein